MFWKTLALACVLLMAACQNSPPSCEQRLAALESLDWGTLRQQEFDGPDDESAEGARIVHHFDQKQTLRRVTVAFFGERGRREFDYRLVTDDTFSLVVNDVSYAQPINPDQPTRGVAEPVARYQICDGEPIVRPTDDAVHERFAPFVQRLAAFAALADSRSLP